MGTFFTRVLRREGLRVSVITAMCVGCGWIQWIVAILVFFLYLLIGFQKLVTHLYPICLQRVHFLFCREYVAVLVEVVLCCLSFSSPSLAVCADLHPWKMFVNVNQW